jgi:hypothetical protein
MRILKEKELDVAISIMAAAFRNNPTFMWLIGASRFSHQRLSELCKYCIQISLLRKGAFISEDSSGVALIYETDCQISHLSTAILHFRLIHKCIGWHRVYKLIKREFIFRRIRPVEKGLYILAIATVHYTYRQKTAVELKNAIFEMADRKGLPIYSETTLLRNRRVYERYGFLTYSSYKFRATDFTVWFMKRPSERKLFDSTRRQVVPCRQEIQK